MEEKYTPLNFSPLPENLSEKNTTIENKKNLVGFFLKLDLFTHFILLILLFSITLVYLFYVKNQTQLKNLSQNNTTVRSPINTVIAAPNTMTSALYISQKIVTVDKKYFNLPDKFQLTLNGPVKKEVFGYLPYWMIDNLNDIDTRLITSISYFGLDVDGEGNITDKTQSDSYNPYNIWQNDKNLDNFFKKMKVNKTKIFLTFKSFNNDNISKLLLSQEASQRFLNNILYQVDSHNLDGVNIDFEYTGVPSENIRNKFSVLISTLNDYLKNRNSKTLLNISVYATAATITQLWDIPYLAYHSDSIIVMGYDFFTPQSGSAGPIAPISGYSNSISGIVNNFLDSMPSEKIILAVPYYGYDWTTINQSENAEVKPNTEVKTLSYAESNDITKNIKTNWDEESQTPWYSFVDASGASHVVHFENLRSIGVKYDIVNNKNLAGAAIWALGLDGNDTRLTQLLIDKFTK